VPKRIERAMTLLHMRDLLESSEIPFATAQFARRKTVFRQGDFSDDVLHIESGGVLLAVSTRSGKEAICGVLGIGAFLGEEALIGHSVRRQTAIAVTATEVLVIGKAHMLQLLRAQPAIAERFIGHLLRRRIRLETDLTDQILFSAEQRLAHTLLVLAGCDERRSCRGVLPRMSQEVIAEMVGTTRSRVNSFMRKFKKTGFIEEDGGVLYVRTSGPAAGMPPAFTPSESRWLRTG
jgi:CRP-like cAMP-binding protein